MRKKIPVEQLRLGMHVHEFCGSWLNHPFWRTKFTLTDTKELNTVQSCGMTHCWIDTDRGLDVAEPATEPVANAAAQAPPPAPPVVAKTLAESVAMSDELKQAAAVCQRSRQAVVDMFSQARMGLAVNSENCLPLVEDIAMSVSRNSAALISLARLKTHDDYTYMHSVAVCALMIALARQLGLDEAQTREAGMAGLLHDLGKAAMPNEVLNKPGKLTDGEFDMIKTHPQRGHQLLLQSGVAGEMVLDVCLHHHEKVDGSGYPDRLAGDQISLHAKMGAVCDVYDAITSDRPYKNGWDPAESIGKMTEWRKGHFDEAVFQAFVKSLGIYPTGSLVRLKSGRLAVVVEQNSSSLVKPKVKVFFSTNSQLHITPELVDLSHPHCRDSISNRESNAQWKFSHLNDLWAEPEALRKMGRAPGSTAS